MRRLIERANPPAFQNRMAAAKLHAVRRARNGVRMRKYWGNRTIY